MKKEDGLLGVLAGKPVWPPPIWLMRQAGRYLPEYRVLRAEAGSFWNMAMVPDRATEITLQPIRRFGFDAAILFSDILTVPEALGCKVTFEAGEGPTLAPVTDSNGLETNHQKWAAYFAPVYDALKGVRDGLETGKTLLGFVGAPWTLATYMAAGRGKDEQKAAKLWGFREPESFDALLDVLAECVAFHACRQIEAGADAIQIFDSWAAGLPQHVYERWVIAPTKKIVTLVRAQHPGAKIIGFPRASTLAGYELYAREVGADAMSVDTATPPDWMAKMADTIPIQGNLDPIVLIAGGHALDDSVDRILAAMRGKPFIFNLGHGILPETPIAHVERLIARVRGAA